MCKYAIMVVLITLTGIILCQAGEIIAQPIIRVRDNDMESASNVSRLSIYTLEDTRVTHLSEADEGSVYRSPTWSFDGKRVAWVIEQGMETRIAWLKIGETNPLSIKGQNDRDPFWLPDHQQIVFLRENHLWRLDTRNNTLTPLAEEIQIDRILGILPQKDRSVYLVYETATTVYLLELNHQFEPIPDNIIELVSDPVWYLLKVVPPAGDRVVIVEKVKNTSQTTLVIEMLNEPKKIRLFEDDYNYTDPCWSPDGKQILFVSDRP